MKCPSGAGGGMWGVGRCTKDFEEEKGGLYPIEKHRVLSGHGTGRKFQYGIPTLLFPCFFVPYDMPDLRFQAGQYIPGIVHEDSIFDTEIPEDDDIAEHGNLLPGGVRMPIPGSSGRFFTALPVTFKILMTAFLCQKWSLR